MLGDMLFLYSGSNCFKIHNLYKLQSSDNINYYYEAGVCIFHFKYLWKRVCRGALEIRIDKRGCMRSRWITQNISPLFCRRPCCIRVAALSQWAHCIQMQQRSPGINIIRSQKDCFEFQSASVKHKGRSKLQNSYAIDFRNIRMLFYWRPKRWLDLGLTNP